MYEFIEWNKSFRTDRKFQAKKSVRVAKINSLTRFMKVSGKKSNQKGKR